MADLRLAKLQDIWEHFFCLLRVSMARWSDGAASLPSPSESTVFILTFHKPAQSGSLTFSSSNPAQALLDIPRHIWSICERT